MPFNLLASKQPSAARATSIEKDDADPSHPIFTIRSNDPEENKLNVFRKMFSVNSDAATRHEPVQPDWKEKRCTLVPPNYTQIFEKRHFPLTQTTNKYEWAEQLVSVPDNGIRTELADMYTLFEQMEKRPLVLNFDDIDLFYEWFSTFLSIVEEMFFLEETCLYAWIEKTDELSAEDRKWESPPNKIVGDLSEARRLKQKGKIMSLGREIRTYKQEFAGRPVLQSLPGLANIIKQFVHELIGYLELKKEVLPNCIKSRFSQKDRRRFEKKYWLTARRMELPAFTVVASTRWMDRREIRRWKTKWFTGPGKGIYGKWKKTFEKKHHEILEEFNRRVIDAQIERQKQVLMHELARARMAEVPEAQYSEPASMTQESCVSSLQNSLTTSFNALHVTPAIQTC